MFLEYPNIQYSVYLQQPGVAAMEKFDSTDSLVISGWLQRKSGDQWLINKIVWWSMVD